MVDQGLNELKGENKTGGKSFPGEGIESAKALRQVCMEC